MRVRDSLLPIVLSLGLLAAGILLVRNHPSTPLVFANAHSKDGQRLHVEIRAEDDQGKSGRQRWAIAVRNTTCRVIEAQASARSDNGTATSDIAATKVTCEAQNVCLHVWLSAGRFISPPRDPTGLQLRHIVAEGDLTVLLGTMAPGQEETILVDLQGGR